MTRHRSKPRSKVQELIGAHFRARRAALRSEREFEKLCKMHPDRKNWRSLESCELMGAEVKAFQNLTKHTPKTAKEAGLIARHMIKVLPDQCGGKVFGRCGPDRASYEDWKIRRTIALCHLETVLRSFAKAA